MSKQINNKFHALQESPGDENCDSKNNSLELPQNYENQINDIALCIYHK